MAYFVTGGTGFIGRNLVDRLLDRKGEVYILVRKESKKKFSELVKQRWSEDAKRVIAITGDLSKKRLGVSKKNCEMLAQKVKHFFHLAAIYDMSADAQSQQIANIDGTKHAIELAQDLKASCFHHASSIAAAGKYDGIFSEDMFEEATGLDDPYFRTKHESEGLVRHECKIPYRIYRPGIVVGHSETGEIDKIDGPYYFFKFLQKVRNVLPPWMPMIGIEGGRINIVPVDFVASAMDHLAHEKGQNGRCFHLTEPKPRRIGEVLNLFARAGHAPQMTMRIDARMFGFIPGYIRKGIAMLPPVRRITDQILNDLGMPRSVLGMISYPTRFDNRETAKLLNKAGIEVPDLNSYAPKLWDYWERNLDPDLFLDRSLKGHVKGRVVLVTGASSGIGKATAIMMAKAGADVLLIARGEDKLQETKAEIESSGGKAFSYVADISDTASCDELMEKVIAAHGTVDILVNNAGRSIRRSIALSFDRFHDYERTMQLNYFGALRLIMGCLPSMGKNHRGQIINISSIGVLTNAPRFSAYVASKAALDAFTRCAASEFADAGIKFTTINMPLVRTPMIAPTKMYNSVPTISPEQAAGMVREAVIMKPPRIATRLGVFAEVAHAVAPRVWQVLMNTAFRLFPDSAAARGTNEAEDKPSTEQIAFASLMRGVHW